MLLKITPEIYEQMKADVEKHGRDPEAWERALLLGMAPDGLDTDPDLLQALRAAAQQALAERTARGEEQAGSEPLPSQGSFADNPRNQKPIDPDSITARQAAAKGGSNGIG